MTRPKRRSGEAWNLGGHDYTSQSICVIEPVDRSTRKANTPFGFSPRDPPPPDKQLDEDEIWEGMGL